MKLIRRIAATLSVLGVVVVLGPRLADAAQAHRVSAHEAVGVMTAKCNGCDDDQICIRNTSGGWATCGYAYICDPWTCGIGCDVDGSCGVNATNDGPDGTGIVQSRRLADWEPGSPGEMVRRDCSGSIGARRLTTSAAEGMRIDLAEFTL